MRWLLTIFVAALLALVAYVASAVVSLDGLVKAARAGDGEAVLQRTDTVRVRRSLVDQIVSAYLRQIGQNRPVKPLERLAANTYGASIADAMIAKLLTPGNLASLLGSGEISAGGTTIAIDGLAELDTSRVLATLHRISPTKPVEFAISLGDTDRDGGISMHFEGNGWKLSGIQLPAAAAQALATSLASGRRGNG